MKLIVACDINGGIGYKNKLPWNNIQGDLQRFKELTQGQTVVMGRNTWDSLPKRPLPNRYNVVVTKLPFTNLPKNTMVVNSIDVIDKDAWIIGGAKLIKSVWDTITEIHLTRTFTEYNCDTHIDLVKLENDFSCWFKEKMIDHTYEIWKRK